MNTINNKICGKVCVIGLSSDSRLIYELEYILLPDECQYKLKRG
jgi:hypothetical protein